MISLRIQQTPVTTQTFAMLRGPVQTSFPALDAFPREAGASGHVYPFSARAASPSTSQADPLRLPSSIASATFWRSPYSEAHRQSKTSAPRRSEALHSGRDYADPGKEKGEGKEKAGSAAAGAAAGGEGKEGGPDLFGDTVLQLRGILCKSSLSSSSRQSGPKVQKRVKFEDSVDKGPHSPRHSQSATCGRSAPRQDPQSPPTARSLSASKATLRMPTLRPPPSDRQQQEEKGGSPQSPSPSPTPQLPNPHHYPHIPKSGAGSLVCASAVSELALPRPAPKGGGYPLSHVHSCSSAGPGSTSSRLSPPTGQDFKVYRPTLACPGLSQSPALQRKGRYFASAGHSGGARTLMRLSRSFTSPAITLPRPVKRPVPSSSSNDDQGPGVQGEGLDRAVTARDVVQAIQAEQQQLEQESGRRESFLDDDKTVQILHWLQEVGHRQAREGRCPVFVSASSRNV